MKYYCVVHGDGFTVSQGPFDDKLTAEMNAYEVVASPVRINDRLYPNKHVLFVDIESREE
jgi:hypothetical protein